MRPPAMATTVGAWQSRTGDEPSIDPFLAFEELQRLSEVLPGGAVLTGTAGSRAELGLLHHRHRVEIPSGGGCRPSGVSGVPDIADQLAGGHGHTGGRPRA